MNVKELTSAVAVMQQQIDELRQMLAAQASAVTHQRAQHLDREQRLLAVARLSAKFPDARSFTAAQVQAEIAETA